MRHTVDILLTTGTHAPGNDRLGHAGMAVDGELASTKHDGQNESDECVRDSSGRSCRNYESSIVGS